MSTTMPTNTMKQLQLTAAMSAALLLSACGSIQEKTGLDNSTIQAGAGAAIGCAGGAFLARATGNNMAAGCALGAVAGGVIGFEKARREELAAAQQAQEEASQALATLPKAQASKVRVGPVVTEQVTFVDKRTKETKKYDAFKQVSLDLTVSTKGTPEYDAAMGKLKTLATRVADERGSAVIEIASAPSDAAAQKVKNESGSVKTEKGATVTVNKIVSAGVPAGMQRLTVRAGSLKLEG